MFVLGQYGVFARRMIPKRTQFGPLEGLLVINNCKEENNGLQLLVESDDESIHRLDVSDESMVFGFLLFLTTIVIFLF